MIYLDNAAGTPLLPVVAYELPKLIGTYWQNPNSIYNSARACDKLIEDYRKKIGIVLGVQVNNILFTNGGSDGNRMLLSQFKQDEILVSEGEHESVLRFAENKIKIKPDGLVDLKDLKANLSNKIRLLSIQYINNETGKIQPIKEIAKIVAEENSKREEIGIGKLFFHTDASQAAVTEDLHVPRLGVDAMTLNGVKFGAIRGSGALYVNSKIFREKLINDQNSNILDIASLALALEFNQSRHTANKREYALILKKIYAELKSEFPKIEINGTITSAHSGHILNLYIPKLDSERLVIALGLKEICISTGAACAAQKDEMKSNVLEGMTADSDRINHSIRISLGQVNKNEDWADIVAKITTEIREVLKFSK